MENDQSYAIISYSILNKENERKKQGKEQVELLKTMAHDQPLNEKCKIRIRQQYLIYLFYF